MSFGSPSVNTYTKVFIVCNESRFTCGESSLCLNFAKFQNILKTIVGVILYEMLSIYEQILTSLCSHHQIICIFRENGVIKMSWLIQESPVLKPEWLGVTQLFCMKNWTFSCRVTSPELSTWLTIEIFFENFLITVSNYHFIKNELHSYTRKNIFTCLLSVQTTCRTGRDEVAQCD